MTAPGFKNGRLRSEENLPSLAQGKIWVGNAQNEPEPEEGTIFQSLVLVGRQIADDDATIEFTGLSDYRKFIVYLDGIVPASSSSFHCLVSNDNGSTWASTGYEASAVYGAYDATTWSGVNATNQISLSGSVTAGGGNLSLSGELTFFNMNEAVKCQMVGQTTFPLSTASDKYCRCICQGLGGATGIDALQFAFASGNIASGVITVYGVDES